jgi:hypothetical protein
MAPAGAMAVVAIAAVVVVMRRLVLVQRGLRLLLGVRRYTGCRLGAVEVWAETPVVRKACMEVKSVHVMVVVW